MPESQRKTTMSNKLQIEELTVIAQSLENVLQVVTTTPVQGVPVHVVNNTINYLDALLSLAKQQLAALEELNGQETNEVGTESVGEETSQATRPVTKRRPKKK